MMNRRFTTPTLGLVLLLGCFAPACTLEKKDDGEEFREAVPLREAVMVAGPETDSAADSSTAAATGCRAARDCERPNGVHPLATRPGAGTDYARWYGFTRAVRSGVNAVTAVVLGSVWAIAHTEPTSVAEGEAVWGPHTDALEPVTYRFRVTRVAEAEYDYVLEGRPKQNSSDDAYRVVLRGHGYGKRHAQHGEGDFTIDLDVARDLDPLAHEGDTGTVHVTHHLPHDIDERLSALPRTITAEVAPDPAVNPESFSVTSKANADGTGSLHVDARADVDASKTTSLEDVVIDSRWRADGAGRADIVIAGGDIPASPGTVSAVECWGADFRRAYYSDSIDYSPSEGDPSACVYDAP